MDLSASSYAVSLKPTITVSSVTRIGRFTSIPSVARSFSFSSSVMELKDKLPSMSEEEQFRLLASDGMLVKRPLLIGDDFVLVGFKEEPWKEALNQ